MEQKIKANCNKANKVFINECLSMYDKYAFLDTWLLDKAYYLKRARERPRRKQKVYQRGALVFIDFGVNVGSEMSNRHFGVVLNKNDSPNNNVLTVVPVTSHGNRFTIELDGLISEKSNDRLEKIKEQNNRFLLCAIRISLETIDLDIWDDNTSRQSFISIKKLITYDEACAEVEKHKEKNENIDDISNSIETYQKKQTEIEELIKKYSRYNKKSFAKCRDIQTISKDRILFVNKYDPTGKIRVSSDTLTKIDEAIKINFTSL